MRQRLIERLFALTQELLHTLVANLRCQSQGVHEHTHRIGHFQVTAAVGYSGDTYLIIAGESRQTVEHGTKQNSRGFHTLLFGQLLGVVPGNMCTNASILALLTRIREVRSQFCYFLYFAQALLEELSGFSKSFATLGGLLFCHKLVVTAHFRLNLFAVQQVTYLMNKQIVRITVTHQVMNVTVQVQRLVCADCRQTEQTVFAQIEGTNKAMTERQSFFFAHAEILHLNRRISVAHHLLHSIVAGDKLNEQSRVVLHGLDSSLLQRLCVGFHGESHAYRRIVQRGSGVLHTVEIHTRLRITQRCGSGRSGLGFITADAGHSTLHHRRKYLVLNTLHTTRLGQSLRVKRHSETFAYLDSQLDSHNGCQAHIT